MRFRRLTGFTILELLVVTGIIAILAGIAIYAYQRAMMRARQKRTMADMRSIGLAWEARASEVRQYNAAGFTMPAETINHPELVSLLAPEYMRTVPQLDGWGNAYIFALDEPIGSATGAAEYAIRSKGGDGRVDAEITTGEFNDPATDIIFSAGQFISYPSGVQ
jgi:prepilin-type N-terminal cleavage/methylation domain-containing protein